MPNVITRPQVKVNKMRKEQYDAIVPASDEFYIITDSPDSVDQVNTPSIVYGTDENGDQTTYEVDSFGNVSDVKLNGTSVVVNKIANIAPEALDVAYTKAGFSDIATVKDALDKLLDNLYYVALSITSFNGGSIEKETGDSVSGSINFTWSYNKDPSSQSLKRGSTVLTNNLSDRSYTLTLDTPITTDTSFVLAASDEQGANPSSTHNITFKSRRYWGVTGTNTIDEAGIKALSSELCTGRGKTITCDCTGGKYIWYVIPTRYASGMSWKDGNGMAFSGYTTSTMDITNAYDHTENYTIYLVNNKQTGSAVKFTIS